MGPPIARILPLERVLTKDREPKVLNYFNIISYFLDFKN